MVKSTQLNIRGLEPPDLEPEPKTKDFVTVSYINDAAPSGPGSFETFNVAEPEHHQNA
jgi:hypothetical protein